jgi:translation initiation factor IF-2
MNKRNPIVVVLGHVDHGKTTLLDAIRKTNVASREAGGITQSIGASVVGGITFIDTPGHAAFSKMRSRGGKVADIAILVVACDDGVAPQTKEAIQIIKETGIPYIVAATKIDVAGVNPEIVRGQLEKEEITFEGRGGNTPFIPLSAKTGAGIPQLLEVINLLSEVNEIKGDPLAPVDAYVIESGKEKMGPAATIVVKNGSIKVGETIFVEDIETKVRALFDDLGKGIKEVLPGLPAQIIGFSKVPPVGARVSKEKVAFEAKVEVKTPYERKKVKEDEIAIVVKAGSVGSLEAVIASLPPKVVVVDSGVGDVTGSDILLARGVGAKVFAFESKIPGDVAKLAEAEKVKCERFEIIYELIQKLEEILKGGKVEILGKATVSAIFPFNDKKIAGSKVTFGKMNKGDRILLMRAEKEIGKAKIISIKKQKLDVAQVGQSEEFGALIEPQLDFAVGDVLVSTR